MLAHEVLTIPEMHPCGIVKLRTTSAIIEGLGREKDPARAGGESTDEDQ